ncbi:DUF885 domain-containing protein [Rhodococcus rhodochrous]|uniref:DUF885 domain-containing protein n=1 Tax=Rhodococcus rhodochrous TaxID=1829 RepID=A0AA47ABW6_RHORH|nr:DUF885 domain-containing protein [Rhodococcus rhodochrous]AYA25508.1 DUF885 domain-containing protein [Rhodococcus rhodochrous]MCB8912816.1 DUF885 domain-containing protein [Rhodococcus rhodochrous]MDJ0399800.1 DUF885 domain-containing protein [Rhodococcus rhodochrous]TWH52972.1 hypothetical protein L612_000200002890 [Rhodococcus rhodochrous J38]UZF46280.1 DUF885 domain-containing protein [Rhodococcus rhodochrous]
MGADDFVNEYLLLGLSFDRLEEGFVDAYTGDPALRRKVENAPTPDPRDLSHTARRLRDELPGAALSDERTRFLDVHLRALDCSARKFAGEEIGFVDEVEAYFDVRIAPGDEDTYRDAHRRLDALLPGTGSLTERMQAHRKSEVIPADRLAECVEAFSSALREKVRAVYPLPDTERVEYEVVGDKPWSGFNYYLGDYRSRVAINSDLEQTMAHLPRLIAHEAYPGHHTEHCRKEAGLVAGGQAEQTLFLVNTPQCLMAEGLADLALEAIVGPGWGAWAQEIYADLGLRFDGELAEQLSEASEQLLSVRQDAALLLHDRGRSHDEVVEFLQRWSLSSPERARQSLRFLSSPLWRAYISTYVEGYRLLGGWLEQVPAGAERADRFRRLLDEPLVPSSLR